MWCLGPFFPERQMRTAQFETGTGKAVVAMAFEDWRPGGRKEGQRSPQHLVTPHVSRNSNDRMCHRTKYAFAVSLFVCIMIFFWRSLDYYGPWSWCVKYYDSRRASEIIGTRRASRLKSRNRKLLLFGMHASESQLPEPNIFLSLWLLRKQTFLFFFQKIQPILKPASCWWDSLQPKKARRRTRGFFLKNPWRPPPVPVRRSASPFSYKHTTVSSFLQT